MKIVFGVCKVVVVAVDVITVCTVKIAAEDVIECRVRFSITDVEVGVVIVGVVVLWIVVVVFVTGSVLPKVVVGVVAGKLLQVAAIGGALEDRRVGRLAVEGLIEDIVVEGGKGV